MPSESHTENTQLTAKIIEFKAMIASLTSQLNESNDRLSLSSSLNQQLRKQLQESEVINASLTSQLLEEVEKNYKLLSDNHDAFSNNSSQQYDELRTTL